MKETAVAADATNTVGRKTAKRSRSMTWKAMENAERTSNKKEGAHQAGKI